MTVEVAAGPVIPGRHPGVAVPRGDLNITQGPESRSPAAASMTSTTGERQRDGGRFPALADQGESPVASAWLRSIASPTWVSRGSARKCVRQQSCRRRTRLRQSRRAIRPRHLWLQACTASGRIEMTPRAQGRTTRCNRQQAGQRLAQRSTAQSMRLSNQPCSRLTEEI